MTKRKRENDTSPPPRGPQKKARQRFLTPPPAIIPGPNSMLQTPVKAAVIGAYWYCQSQGLPCTERSLTKPFGISRFSVTDILKNKDSCRRPSGGAISRPDDQPRHAPAKLKPHDDAKLYHWVATAPKAERKELGWKDALRRISANSDVSLRTIQNHTKKLGVATRKMMIKEELDEDILYKRMTWSMEMLKDRQSWSNVYFLDEIHWGCGPRNSSNIKRLVGQTERFKPENIDYIQDARARKATRTEPDEFPTFHAICIVGYNWRWWREYEIPSNKNGKMTANFYIEFLEELLPVFRKQKLVLFHDRDSAHISNKVKNWLKTHQFPVIEPPPKSPDLSVMETWAKPLRGRFFERRTETKKEGLQRAKQVFLELNQDKIKQNIDSYRARLHEVVRAEGKMTKY